MKPRPFLALVGLEFRRYPWGFWVRYFLGCAFLALVCWLMSWPLAPEDDQYHVAGTLLVGWVPALLLAGSLANCREISLTGSDTRRDRRVLPEFLIVRPASRSAIFLAQTLVLYSPAVVRCLALLVWACFRPGLRIASHDPAKNAELLRIFPHAVVVPATEWLDAFYPRVVWHVLPAGNVWLMLNLLVLTFGALVLLQVLELLRQSELQVLLVVVILWESMRFFLFPLFDHFPDPSRPENLLPDGSEIFLYFVEHAGIICLITVAALIVVNASAWWLFRRRDVL